MLFSFAAPPFGLSKKLRFPAKLPADRAEVQPEQIAMFKALTQVHKEYLQAFFDEVDNTWGGTAGYLHNGLGFTGEQLNQLKKMYLEKM